MLVAHFGITEHLLWMSVRYGRRIPGPLKLKVWYSTWLAVLACHFLVIALGSLLLSVLTLPLISDRRPLEEEDDDDDGDGDDGDHEDDMRTTRVDAVNVNCLKLLRACARSGLAQSLGQFPRDCRVCQKQENTLA